MKTVRKRTRTSVCLLLQLLMIVFTVAIMTSLVYAQDLTSPAAETTDLSSSEAFEVNVNKSEGIITMTMASKLDHIRYAPGVYTTSKEIRAAAGMKDVNSTIIANGTIDDVFTYMLPVNGTYSFWIRFTDGSVVIEQVEINGPVPEIIVNGLQVTVKGLEDIRIVRTSPGEWSTSREIKTANGIRNFRASHINGADSFTIQYREDGMYTIALEYYTGLVVIQTFEIEHKEPVVEQDGNTVTFKDLDDLYVIRYTKG